MRLFGWGGDGPKVPRDLVARMGRLGRHEIDPMRSLDDGPAIWAETQQPLLELSQTDPAGLIHALAAACLPVGGWTVYGAERTVENLIRTDSSDP